MFLSQMHLRSRDALFFISGALASIYGAKLMSENQSYATNAADSGVIHLVTHEGQLEYHNSTLGLQFVIARNCRLTSLWQNMGYEESSEPFAFLPDRSRNLALKVAEYAGIGAHDEKIVDLGGGYGDMAFLIHELGAQAVTVVNLAGMNIAVGRQMARARGLEGVVNFVHGDATDLSFIPSGSVDKVTCVDAVFLWAKGFPEDDHYLEGVGRILRQGGKYAWTDYVINDGVTHEQRETIRTSGFFLDHNHDFPGRTNSEYNEYVKRAGFSHMESIDITAKSLYAHKYESPFASILDVVDLPFFIRPTLQRSVISRNNYWAKQLFNGMVEYHMFVATK